VALSPVSSGRRLLRLTHCRVFHQVLLLGALQGVDDKTDVVAPPQSVPQGLEQDHAELLCERMLHGVAILLAPGV